MSAAPRREADVPKGAKAPTQELMRAYVKGYGRVNNAIHRIAELFAQFDMQTGKQGRVDWTTIGELARAENHLERAISGLQSAADAAATKRRAH